MRLIEKYKYPLIWCLIYLIAVYTLSREFLRFSSNHRFLQFFLWVNLFRAEAYYVGVLAFFISFLYVVKKPFHTVFFISRCKEFYLWHILLFGIKVCLFFIIYTAALFIGLPFLLGILMVHHDNSMFFNFLNLFMYVFSIYLLYMLALLLTGKQILSLAVTLAINLSIGIIRWTVEHTASPIALIRMEHFISNYYILVAVVLLGAIVLVFKRKDFLI